MAQTLTSLYYHIVFSTKNRVDLIRPEIEDELYAYIGGIMRNLDSRLLIGNGTSNHSHLLCSAGKLVLIPNLVGTIKRNSSKWIKAKGGLLTKFAWQDGYSIFTIGHSQLKDVERYIARQKEHHKKVVFEDEMRTFYKKYEVPFDEEYVWD
jgi:putative transposase